MNIVSANFILTMDKEFNILIDKAIAYDKTIIKIGELKELKEKYPQAKVSSYEKNSIIMPGLINTHIHLEYLTNKSRLEYGEFTRWLKSVIKNRQELIDSCSDKLIRDSLNSLLDSGTTTIGEISSFGIDIQPCKESLINVILFNEILGSNPSSVDILYQNFLERLELTKSLKSSDFIPAISIHSPYSTHPILAKKALKEARDDSMLVSTHFMESLAEREWLDQATGRFKELLENFTPDPKPLLSSREFIEMFQGLKTIFTHTLYATKEELKYIDQYHYIAHCPVSNRLLENKKLDISKLQNITLATDGLTSNISLNLWDELRAALLIHQDIDIDLLSRKLLYMVSANAADALGLNKGRLQEGYDSDLIVVNLDQDFDSVTSIAKWIILHTTKVTQSIVGGISHHNTKKQDTHYG